MSVSSSHIITGSHDATVFMTWKSGLRVKSKVSSRSMALGEEVVVGFIRDGAGKDDLETRVMGHVKKSTQSRSEHALKCELRSLIMIFAMTI